MHAGRPAASHQQRIASDISDPGSVRMRNLNRFDRVTTGNANHAVAKLNRNAEICGLLDQRWIDGFPHINNGRNPNPHFGERKNVVPATIMCGYQCHRLAYSDAKAIGENLRR